MFGLIWHCGAWVGDGIKAPMTEDATPSLPAQRQVLLVNSGYDIKRCILVRNVAISARLVVKT